MAQNLMNIPSNIIVGYQNRNDTYTGKLAYVVYKDSKGVLRKERSWSSWRDESIKQNEFKNEPTEGFVLNKKAGDHSGGWDQRKAWCRVYDPRGFEFEITIDNLLFILEECTSTKGKGLEGEFVYAWHKADLVLLPVSSVDYQRSARFTDMQTEKVTKSDMVPGHTYLTKDMQEVVYLGRHNWYGFHTDYQYTYRKVGLVNKGKHHVFHFTDTKRDGCKVFIQKGFTKIAKVASEETHAEFSKYLNDFKTGPNGSDFKEVVIEDAEKPTVEGLTYNYHWNLCFIWKESGIHTFRINHVGPYKKEQWVGSTSPTPITVDNSSVTYTLAENVSWHGFQEPWHSSPNICVGLDTILEQDFCEVFIVNQAGYRFKVG